MSLLLFFILAAPPDAETLRQAHLDARLGTRITGDSIVPFEAKTIDGQTLQFGKLPHLTRIVAFLEPLASKAGLERLGWWQKNQKVFTQAGIDVVLVASDAPDQGLDLQGMRVIADHNGFLAATFGVLQRRAHGWGAAALAFLIDDTGVIRRVEDVAAATQQGQRLLTAGKILRRQLLEVHGQ